MNEKIKIIKKSEQVQIDPDLRRLAISMRNILKRKFPNPLERDAVAAQIMQQVRTA